MFFFRVQCFSHQDCLHLHSPSPKMFLLKCLSYLLEKFKGQATFRCWITKVQLLGLLRAALHGGLDKGLNGQ